MNQKIEGRALKMQIKAILAACGTLALSIGLSGCISLGAEAPSQFLTLTPASTLAAGGSAEGLAENALSVQIPSVSQRLNVNRIPVTTSDSSLAYLQDAFWVEKPASLFANVLSETIRAGGERLVLDGGELQYTAQTQLSGELVEFGFHAPSGSAIVRYDAMLRLPDGTIRTRRFEESVSGVLPEAGAVGSALNEAANKVAADVAQWVG